MGLAQCKNGRIISFCSSPELRRMPLKIAFRPVTGSGHIASAEKTKNTSVRTEKNGVKTNASRTPRKRTTQPHVSVHNGARKFTGTLFKQRSELRGINPKYFMHKHTGYQIRSCFNFPLRMWQAASLQSSSLGRAGFRSPALVRPPPWLMSRILCP